MRPYELQRPNGEPSGVWACGECGRVHLIAYTHPVPDGHANQLSAELCCAPHDCIYCGKPTERALDGQFPWSHRECTKVDPPPPHPSMSDPFARLLYQRISNLCEDRYHSGWMECFEFDMWAALHGNVHPESYAALTPEEKEELQTLCTFAGGWIWAGGVGNFIPQLVSLQRWDEILQSGNQPPP
jgi:hypothetical protein